jgi:hypothetical protein
MPSKAFGTVMGDYCKRDKWLEDIEARQRNIVLPETVENERPFNHKTSISLLFSRRILNRARCRLFRSLLAAALLCVSVAAQPKVPPPKPSPPAVPTFDVKLSPDPNLSIGLPDNMLVISTQCDADGNPYVWTLGPSGRQILGLTPKGVITFATNQMTDIPEPTAGDFFVADSALYVLVAGIENAQREEVIYKDEAGQDTKRLETKGESRDYIARFDSDGSYRGAQKLDAGFRPLQLAAFGSRNFVVAGLDEGKTPRVGLLNSSGQL